MAKTWEIEYINDSEEKYWTEVRLDGRTCTAYIYFDRKQFSTFRISVWDRPYDHGGARILDNWFRIGPDGVELESDGCRLTALMNVRCVKSLENSVLKIAIQRLMREL